MSTGKFIVFEGLDGSGKTTQINRLSEHLKKNNIPHIVTKEPTDNPIGALARCVVRGEVSLTKEALSLLFAADRAEHIATEISPALSAGKFVLCDRYIYSNMAYQNGVQVVTDSHHLKKPDLTIFIDTSPEECTRRIIANRQSMDIYDGIKISQQIRTKYLESFRRYKLGMPVEIINGDQQEDEIFSKLLSLPMFYQVL